MEAVKGPSVLFLCLTDMKKPVLADNTSQEPACFWGNRLYHSFALFLPVPVAARSILYLLYSSITCLRLCIICQRYTRQVVMKYTPVCIHKA